MLAVNGYDESAEQVKRFVDKKKLTHPIVLMGGKTASESYGVRGYPTSFWLDREGKVVSFDVGFGEGGQKELKATLEKMLAPQ